MYVLVFLLRRTHCFSGKLGLDERRRAVTATESVDPLETTVDTFFFTSTPYIYRASHSSIAKRVDMTERFSITNRQES